MVKALQKRYKENGKNKKASIFLKKIHKNYKEYFFKENTQKHNPTVMMNNRILSISQVFSLEINLI